MSCRPALLGRLFAGFATAALCLAPVGAFSTLDPGPSADPSASETAALESSLRGRLLIAVPEMRSPVFAKTVIYMVEHDSNGAMGLVVNRPVGKMPFEDLAEILGKQPPEESGAVRIHFGGPVEQEIVFVLHSADVLIRSSKELAHGLAVTSDAEILGEIMDGRAPERFMVAFGYAGWGPGQLESELERGSWEVVDYQQDLVLGEGADKWKRALESLKLDL